MSRYVRKLALTWLIACAAAGTARAEDPESAPTWLEPAAARISFDAIPLTDGSIDDLHPLAVTLDLKAALAPRRGHGRFAHDLDRRWSLGLRGDTGGTSLFGGAHCRLSDNWGLFLGYRANRLDSIETRIHTGGGSDLYQHGVFIGLRLTF